jgi:hypothetical protein
MLLKRSKAGPYWRTLLILARASNLPTIWSNCLAGWLLGGGGDLLPLLLLGLGATCLYASGMFLNDAFDAEFDHEHRRDRPIPAGDISLDEVWAWGFGWLGLGAVILVLLGKVTATLAVLLAAGVVVYNATHRVFSLAPLLMAVCRLLLYLVAASVAVDGVTGLAVWSGLAMAAYIAGLSFLSRRELSKGPVESWPAWCLGAPILLGLICNGGDHRFRAVILCLALGLWTLRSLRYAFWVPARSIGLAVSGLVAGIVLADLLAVAGGGHAGISLIFLTLFAATLVSQRFVPGR